MLFVDILQVSIAIISLIISSALACREYRRSKPGFDLKIIDFAKRTTTIQFFVFFQNKSSCPLTISSVCLWDGSPFVQCELIPKKILKKTDYTISTPMFPINLSPYQGLLCYLEFVSPRDIPIVQGKRVDLRVYTSHGMKDLSLILPSPDHYLHIKR